VSTSSALSQLSLPLSTAALTLLASPRLSATPLHHSLTGLVTPLDVVRVRLQSQETPKTTSSAPRSYGGSALAHLRDLPPNLGITTCCREVFWINNKAPFCVAGPTMAPINPADLSCAVEEVERRTINSTWDGLRKIAQNEGPRTLWRGLSPTLVMAVPSNVIYFAGYDWLRTARASPFRETVSDAYIPLVAGASARTLAAIVVSPIEMFRTRMQAANHTATAAGHFRETMDGVRGMVASQGVFSLWRGLTLTLWRDVPFSAIYWWGYEATRNVLIDVRGRSEAKKDGFEFRVGRGEDKIQRRSRSRSREHPTDTLVDSFIAGAVSGGIAAFVTTPFDVGKTRQQVVRHLGETAKDVAQTARPEDQTMPRFLMHIYREQGAAGLFKGWAARCLKIAPACAIMISCYELGKKMANDMNERRDRERLE
jgi:solute carrier family 25 protein 39/40